MDTSILEDLGLTQAEIRVYIALLELGSSTAGNILEKSKLHNSVTHRALNTLIEKGLISFIKQGKRKLYQATDPENFHDFIENKKARFDQILPELKQKQKINKITSFGEIFKGKKGINQLYTSLLNSKGKEYNTFGGGKRVSYDAMGAIWWKNLHSKIRDKKIKARQVFDETIRKLGQELTKISKSKIRYLPKEYEQLQETIILGDMVGIAIFTENPYGILIKDKAVADGYRKQFEILWNKAKQ